MKIPHQGKCQNIFLKFWQFSLSGDFKVGNFFMKYFHASADETGGGIKNTLTYKKFKPVEAAMGVACIEFH
jgi:hypothetical protein